MATDPSLRALYLDIWKEMLGECLDWTPQEVEHWSSRFTLMHDQESIFYHHSPLHYVSPLLTPQSIQSNGRADYDDFECRLETILQECNNRMLDKPTIINWDECRIRLESLYDTVGTSLSEVRRSAERYRLEV